MRILLLLFILIYSSTSIACRCAGGCLDGKPYNIVAEVEIIEESSKYLQAFKAKIIKMKHYKPTIQLDENFNVVNNKDFEGAPYPEYITIANYGLRPIPSDLNKSEIIVGGCAGGGYTIGSKHYFFGRWVQEGVYATSSCSCSIRLQ